VALLACGLGASPASALVIHDYFSADLQSASNAALIESVIQETTANIGRLYSNPGEVSILFTGNLISQIGIGGSRGTYYALYAGDYNYLSAFNSAAHPENHAQAEALQYLGYGNAADPSSVLLVTSANLGALGIAAPGAYDLNGDFQGGGPNVLGGIDGVIDLKLPMLSFDPNPPAYDGTNVLYAARNVIGHEVDEVLGIGGAGSNLNNIYALSNGGTTGDPALDAFYLHAFGVLDRFRYAAPGVPTLSQDPFAPGYFSLDGGQTDLADFNNYPGYGDAGDLALSTECPDHPGLYGGAFGAIQNAFNCPNLPSVKLHRGMVEDLMLQSIGYNPAVPEPGTWAMMLAGLFLAGWRLRGRRIGGAGLGS